MFLFFFTINDVEKKGNCSLVCKFSICRVYRRIVECDGIIKLKNCALISYTDVCASIAYGYLSGDVYGAACIMNVMKVSMHVAHLSSAIVGANVRIYV